MNAVPASRTVDLYEPMFFPSLIQCPAGFGTRVQECFSLNYNFIHSWHYLAYLFIKSDKWMYDSCKEETTVFHHFVAYAVDHDMYLFTLMIIVSSSNAGIISCFRIGPMAQTYVWRSTKNYPVQHPVLVVCKVVCPWWVNEWIALTAHTTILWCLESAFHPCSLPEGVCLPEKRTSRDRRVTELIPRSSRFVLEFFVWRIV